MDDINTAKEECKNVFWIIRLSVGNVTINDRDYYIATLFTNVSDFDRDQHEKIGLDLLAMSHIYGEIFIEDEKSVVILECRGPLDIQNSIRRAKPKDDIRSMEIYFKEIILPKYGSE